MSAPCLMQGLTLLPIKTLNDNQYGDKQEALVRVDAPTRLQQRDEHSASD